MIKPNPTYVYTFIMDSEVITNVEGWPCYAYTIPLEEPMPRINWSRCWMTGYFFSHEWKFNHGEPMCGRCGRYASDKEIEELVSNG